MLHMNTCKMELPHSDLGLSVHNYPFKKRFLIVSCENLSYRIDQKQI